MAVDRLHLRKRRRQRQRAKLTSAQRRMQRRHPAMWIGVDMAKPGDDRSIIMPLSFNYDGNALAEALHREKRSFMAALVGPLSDAHDAREYAALHQANHRADIVRALAPVCTPPPALISENRPDFIPPRRRG